MHSYYCFYLPKNLKLKMKNYTIILLFLFANHLSSVAQSPYDYRLSNDRQRTETGAIRTICPCEAAQFFSTWQNRLSNRSVIISQNCPLYTQAFSSNRASEGLTFSDFFKRFKRKRKVTYSKGSHIIPL
jgi:hypothetical protein